MKYWEFNLFVRNVSLNKLYERFDKNWIWMRNILHIKYANCHYHTNIIDKDCIILNITYIEYSAGYPDNDGTPEIN